MTEEEKQKSRISTWVWATNFNSEKNKWQTEYSPRDYFLRASSRLFDDNRSTFYKPTRDAARKERDRRNEIIESGLSQNNAAYEKAFHATPEEIGAAAVAMAIKEEKGTIFCCEFLKNKLREYLLEKASDINVESDEIEEIRNNIFILDDIKKIFQNK